MKLGLENKPVRPLKRALRMQFTKPAEGFDSAEWFYAVVDPVQQCTDELDRFEPYLQTLAERGGQWLKFATTTRAEIEELIRIAPVAHATDAKLWPLVTDIRDRIDEALLETAPDLQLLR